jgi:endonuclease/exonuclease/phosphatase family metal-dependent hydrolase
MAVSARRRSRRLLGVLVALGLALSLPSIVQRLTSPSRRLAVHHLDLPEPTRHGSDWRVGAWNLAHGRGLAKWTIRGGDAATRAARLEAIARRVASLDLDLLVLNEVDFDASSSRRVDQARFIAERAGFPHRVAQRNDDAWLAGFRWAGGNAILSRHPLREVSLIDLPVHRPWLAALGFQKRGVAALVERAPGDAIRLVAIHLEHRSEDVRLASAEKILRFAAAPGPPTLLAGDFNSTLGHFPHAKPSASGHTALDHFLGAGFSRWTGVAPSPEQMTYRSDRPSRVIDWILVPDDWSFDTYHVLPTDLSDHRPVWAAVRPPPTGAR